MACLPIRAILVATIVLVPTIAAVRSFTIEEDHFVRDGQIYQIFSGCIHYSRVHPSYWADRLTRIRAMGLNSIETCKFGVDLRVLNVYIYTYACMYLIIPHKPFSHLFSSSPTEDVPWNFHNPAPGKSFLCPLFFSLQFTSIFP